MASFSPIPPTTLFTLSARPNFPHKPQLTLLLKRSPSLFLQRYADNGVGVVVVEEKEEESPTNLESEVKKRGGGGGGELLGSNGGVVVGVKAEVSAFKDPRWVKGTWDLKQFEKNGTTHWDSVIDAEARRRKWLEDNPEASTNDESVVFNSSIIPWWAWIKRFHLPEAELLNGRAAMIGFFMAYFADSLTGVGLVDQMGNFFCKTLLFVAVAGVLVIRRNEDVETVKKLIEETTFYDKQWQATWQGDSSGDATSK